MVHGQCKLHNDVHKGNDGNVSLPTLPSASLILLLQNFLHAVVKFY